MKTCPFCGSKDIRPADEGQHYGECLDCGAYGPSPEDHTASEGWLIQEANRLWDQRAEELIE